jgi:hypothetical protein
VKWKCQASGVGGKHEGRRAGSKSRFHFGFSESKLFSFKQLNGSDLPMFSSVLVVALAISATQADTTRTSREAYTACLRAFMNHSIEGHMTVDAFNAALATTCTAERIAFHDAVVRRESASRATRGNAEQSATEEVNDATTNFRERFEMAMSPQ